MNYCFEKVLTLIKDRLPESLINEDGYARFSVLAKQLPEDFSPFWGIECRLGNPEAVGDILLEIQNNSPGCHFLAGETHSLLDNLCDNYRTWKQLRQFAQSWKDPAHPFFHQIRNVWLEFDTAEKQDNNSKLIQTPSVFLGPDPKTISFESLPQLISMVTANLGDEKPKLPKLDTFLKSLPALDSLFQIGLMLGRPDPGLRLCVYGIAPLQVSDWLEKAGWEGDFTMVESLLKKSAPLVQLMAINLNMTAAGLDEKIGFECYQNWFIDKPEQWIPLLSWIQKQGLCLEKKYEGVLQYPGICRSSFQSRLQKDEMLYMNILLKIHHLKLVVADGILAEAKAYLAVNRPKISLQNMRFKKNHVSD